MTAGPLSSYGGGGTSSPIPTPAHRAPTLPLLRRVHTQAWTRPPIKNKRATLSPTAARRVHPSPGRQTAPDHTASRCPSPFLNRPPAHAARAQPVPPAPSTPAGSSPPAHPPAVAAAPPPTPQTGAPAASAGPRRGRVPPRGTRSVADAVTVAGGPPRRRHARRRRRPGGSWAWTPARPQSPPPQRRRRHRHEALRAASRRAAPARTPPERRRGCPPHHRTAARPWARRRGSACGWPARGPRGAGTAAGGPSRYGGRRGRRPHVPAPLPRPRSLVFLSFSSPPAPARPPREAPR